MSSMKETRLLGLGSFPFDAFAVDGLRLEFFLYNRPVTCGDGFVFFLFGLVTANIAKSS